MHLGDGHALREPPQDDSLLLDLVLGNEVIHVSLSLLQALDDFLEGFLLFGGIVFVDVLGVHLQNFIFEQVKLGLGHHYEEDVDQKDHGQVELLVLLVHEALVGVDGYFADHVVEVKLLVFVG